MKYDRLINSLKYRELYKHKQSLFADNKYCLLTRSISQTKYEVFHAV